MPCLTVPKVRNLLEDVISEIDYIDNIIAVFESNNFANEQQISMCRESTLAVMFDNLADRDYAASIVEGLKKRLSRNVAVNTVSLYIVYLIFY